jgi:hypothetical protein
MSVWGEGKGFCERRNEYILTLIEPSLVQVRASFKTGSMPAQDGEWS